MDLSVGIAIAAAIFSGSGVGFDLLTLRQTASKDALEIMHKEMETFRPALDECRAECAPSIMLWGILIWASWIVLFGLLIEEHIVADNRASANAQRFKEILENQSVVIKHVDSYMTPVNTMLSDDKIMIDENEQALTSAGRRGRKPDRACDAPSNTMEMAKASRSAW
jgi:hypothetical protein